MVVMAYRTQDRVADFGFSLEFQPEIGWRVYIVFLPVNDQELCFPYQSADRNGRHYVDWAARIGSLGEARIVAELWAEIARRYQHSDVRIRNNDTAADKAPTATPPRFDAA